MIDIPQRLSELIVKALDARASDIHIQPDEDDYQIRFRVDGILVSDPSLSSSLAAQLIARIKVLSQLDVAERRRPQDGTFSFTQDPLTCDIRVATFPSFHGEKVVLRLLDRQAPVRSLDQLGLDKTMCTRIKHLLSLKNGFILVTGPTGSGKTTTVHALLSSLDRECANIVTLEDPIEYMIRGVTQSQIHPEIGLTFEAGLRSLLRQDPDIIMVGEIRDHETARVAVHAALTGHQVFSTFHANDAPSALIRFMHMGIEGYLVAASVKAIIAQRLVRRLCQSCMTPMQLTDEQSAFLKPFGTTVPDHLYKGIGCQTCRGTGYYGRIGIFEFLELTQKIRKTLINNGDYDQLLSCSLDNDLSNGMATLMIDGYEKLKKGLISYADLICMK